MSLVGRRRCHVVGTIGMAVLWAALMPSCTRFPDPLGDDVVLGPGDVDELLDRHTDSSRVGGSDMVLLIDGPPSREAFETLIRSACDHINIETLEFDDDQGRSAEVGLEFARMLAAKAQEGVEVNVILDPIATIMESSPAITQVLIDGAVNVRDYVVPLATRAERLVYRTHKKIMVVDGRQAVIGGMNFGVRYLGEDQWRDTNVLLTGPVVASLQRQFLDDWKMLGGQIGDEGRYFPELAPTGDLSIRDIDQQPVDKDYDLNMAVLIGLRTAEDRVDIEAPYFNPNDELREELFAASERGVAIRILTNSVTSIDLPDIFPMMAYHFEDLLDHGIRVFLWVQGDRTMHSKAMVVDDTMAMVGSYNFNYRSIVWDTENAVIFTDPEAIAEVAQMVDDDFSVPHVMEIDRNWLDAQDEADRDLWELAHLVGWLF